MNFFDNDAKTVDLVQYRYLLNRIVAESSFKDSLSEEDKLAKVLLFNIDFYSKYQQQEGLYKTNFILDFYADIKQDRNDIFQRQIIDLARIPKQVRKYLFKEYKDCYKFLDKDLKSNKLFVEVNSEEKPAEVVDNKTEINYVKNPQLPTIVLEESELGE